MIQLALRPRKAEGELGRLRLTVDAQSYDIVGAEIVDPLGNVTRLRFSDLRRNTGLDDAQFRFEVPAGRRRDRGADRQLSSHAPTRGARVALRAPAVVR